MAKADETALLWGGLAAAAAVAAVIWRRRQADAAAASPAPLSPYPTLPTVKAPVMTAPGYAPPVVGAAPPPAVVVAPAPIVAAPAPAVAAPTAAAQNQAFTAAVNLGHELQRQDFERGAADLLQRVQSGQLAPGSAEYASAFDYLSNLTGGVATQGAEAAKLTAAGLPPPAA